MACTRLRKLVNSSSFWTQTNGLLRKNLTFQKRNKKANIRLILFPVILCVLLTVAQYLFDEVLPKTDFMCPDNKKTCNQKNKICDMAQCAVRRPQELPPLLQLPAGLCKKNGACPFNIIFTADNQSFAQTVSDKMFPSALIMNDSEIVLGFQPPPKDNNVTDSPLKKNKKINFDPALLSMPGPSLPNFYLQTQCPQNNSGFSFPNLIGISCGQVINLWRNSSSDINNELYKRQVNGVVSAFDFLNSNEDGFNIALWYNSTVMGRVTKSEIKPRFVNLLKKNMQLGSLYRTGPKSPVEKRA
ncbi:ABC transporter A family protein, putative [Medicago truncatula]|uniref:ABC transporter A family protein, putative n=1 Tax=Medicago truncatula TaxID=3880 RepID=G7JQW8_MEDTR|nr:ABC transporter A family protein, putative [Medicago truncatula]